ncbi:MAG: hypothetical protein ABEI13_01925, partial [Candidatus Paceibacteria bacterium]
MDSKIPIKLYEYYIAAWMTATSHHPVGINVLDLEWDTLILLDTCRVDALREVAPEYDFLNDSPLHGFEISSETSDFSH